MLRKFFIFFSLVIALFITADSFSVPAEGATYTEAKKTSSYTRIFYYRQGKNALASLNASYHQPGFWLKESRYFFR